MTYCQKLASWHNYKIIQWPVAGGILHYLNSSVLGGKCILKVFWERQQKRCDNHYKYLFGAIALPVLRTLMVLFLGLCHGILVHVCCYICLYLVFKKGVPVNDTEFFYDQGTIKLHFLNKMQA